MPTIISRDTSGNLTPKPGHWNTQKAKLKLLHTKLTAQDLYFKHGEKEEMMMRVQTKLKMTRDELDTLIATL